MENELDKTLDAINKLKEVEIELHRLKNALEMMNRAYEAKKEWISLTDAEIELLCEQADHSSWKAIELTQARLKEKNL
jgi:benzoyl-CoA reductase/2-hydroxyglutaryl-CoA dehydratase subunit BcrC/BadD/HgdB